MRCLGYPNLYFLQVRQMTLPGYVVLGQQVIQSCHLCSHDDFVALSTFEYYSVMDSCTVVAAAVAVPTVKVNEVNLVGKLTRYGWKNP